MKIDSFSYYSSGLLFTVHHKTLDEPIELQIGYHFTENEKLVGTTLINTPETIFTKN